MNSIWFFLQIRGYKARFKVLRAICILELLIIIILLVK